MVAGAIVIGTASASLASPPAAASAQVVGTTFDLVAPAPAVLQANDPSAGGNPDSRSAEPRGIKSALVKLALKAIAKAIRGGANGFINLASKFLDDAAEKAIRNNASKIADVIEDVADLPGVLTHTAKDKIRQGLEPLVGGGTANVIANAVVGVLELFL